MRSKGSLCFHTRLAVTRLSSMFHNGRFGGHLLKSGVLGSKIDCTVERHRRLSATSFWLRLILQHSTFSMEEYLPMDSGSPACTKGHGRACSSDPLQPPKPIHISFQPSIIPRAPASSSITPITLQRTMSLYASPSSSTTSLLFTDLKKSQKSSSNIFRLSFATKSKCATGNRTLSASTRPKAPNAAPSYSPLASASGTSSGARTAKEPTEEDLRLAAKVLARYQSVSTPHRGAGKQLMLL